MPKKSLMEIASRQYDEITAANTHSFP